MRFPTLPVGAWLWSCLSLGMIGVALGGGHLAGWLGLPERDVVVGAPFTDTGVLGTDYLGRDVAARTLAGGAPLVLAPSAAALIAEIIGAAIALLTAWPGWWRVPVRVVTDVALVVPAMIVILVLVSGPGLGPASLVIVVVAATVGFTSRYLGRVAESIISRGFVETSLAAGDSRLRVSIADIAPCMLRPMLTDVGIRFVGAVQLVATVAFLGGATTDGGANWAVAIQRNLSGIMLNPWAVCAPAAMIALLCVPVSIVADRWSDR
ncbi:ABC transporter permease subunit [Williamsia sp. CHRR-6]|uniref:ABC transporter permease subunit n=1 Tax=Williamsia sp. CHRR-6 TaxID=2835871 RepID=UPI001BD95EC4|nr:ABC transporter permease subunit [Williamsia sp. CHRR-6]MBT0565614.1 ABC transporter permease subunit [Williamsia sp. CHRR-6]